MTGYLKRIFLCVIAVVLLCALSAGVFAEEKTASDPSLSYVKQNAPYEDASLDLWFEHSFTKVLTKDTTPSGMDTYSVYMAKNEIENAQFVLYSDETKTGMTASVTNFTNKNGDVLPAEIYYELYITTSGLDTTCVLGSTAETTIIREGETPDPIAPLKNVSGGVFQLNGGKSQAFLIRIRSDETTPSGWYSAQLDIKNSSGQIVKTATVYCYVWDFTISEKTEFQTALFVDNKTAYGGTYQGFYDYLLENRLVAMDIPGELKSTNPYLTNPRVNAIRVTAGGGGSAAYYMDAAHNYYAYANIYNELSTSSIWDAVKDKFYFYTVDEPMSQEQQDCVLAAGGVNSRHTVEDVIETDLLLDKYWGDTAQTCVPYHENHPYPYYHYQKPLTTYGTEELRDATQAMIDTDSCRLWCPHLNAFTPREELSARGYFNDYHNTTIRNITRSISGMYTTGNASTGYTYHSGFYDWDGLFGEFADRVFSDIAIKSRGEGGEAYKMWAYLAGCNSAYTYCHHLIENTGLQTKMLFWQFYQEDITGYLYYATNEWGGTPDNTQTGAKTNANWLTNKSTYPSGYSIYGAGSLFYGNTQGKIQGKSCIGTLRVELMRDGVEEYQMLKMLEGYVGETVAKNLVAKISKNVVNYLSLPEFDDSAFDSSLSADDIMAMVRIELGDAVEAAAEKGQCSHSFDEGVVVKNATCLKMGTLKRTCTKCDAESIENIPTLHAEGDCFVKISGTVATCTKAGSEIYECNICGYKKTVETPAHHSNPEKYNHTYKNETTHNIICSVCSELIESEAHVFFEKNSATCTAAGERVSYCHYCEYSTVAGTTDPLGHYVEIVSTEATCTEEGFSGEACIRCDHREGTVVAPKGHSYGSDNICVDCGEEKVLPEYLVGDVDGDWDVTAKDLNMMKKYLSGQLALTENQSLAADITKDGDITAVDMNRLVRFLSGTITEF